MKKIKKCNHLQDTLQLYRRDIKQDEEDRGKRPSQIFSAPQVYRYSSIRILYETTCGRVVNCFLCKRTWYTQAKYSQYLSMQR